VEPGLPAARAPKRPELPGGSPVSKIGMRGRLRKCEYSQDHQTPSGPRVSNCQGGLRIWRMTGIGQNGAFR